MIGFVFLKEVLGNYLRTIVYNLNIKFSKRCSIVCPGQYAVTIKMFDPFSDPGHEKSFNVSRNTFRNRC